MESGEGAVHASAVHAAKQLVDLDAPELMGGGYVAVGVDDHGYPFEERC